MDPKPQSGSDVISRTTYGIYRIDWCRNGYCYVVSHVNHSLIGAYVDGVWDDAGKLPDPVRAIAMLRQPEGASL